MATKGWGINRKLGLKQYANKYKKLRECKLKAKGKKQKASAKVMPKLKITTRVKESLALNRDQAEKKNTGKYNLQMQRSKKKERGAVKRKGGAQNTTFQYAGYFTKYFDVL